MKLAMDWLQFLCCVNAVADPGEGPGGGALPRYFKTGLPPYLYRGGAVWIRHWYLVCVVLVNTWPHCWPKNVDRCCVRLHVVALECSVFCRIAIWVCFGEAVASFIGYHEVAQEPCSKQSLSEFDTKRAAQSLKLLPQRIRGRIVTISSPEPTILFYS